MQSKGNNVFVSFLELLNVKHTKEFSNKYFNEHSHKYNLFGLSKMLSDYGIENAGTKIQDKEKDLHHIELPFVAHFGGEFVIVYKIYQDKVHILWNGKEMAIPADEFIQSWSGIILLTEKTPESIEPNHKEHRKTEWFTVVQKFLLVFAGILIFGIAYVKHSLFTDLGLNLLLITNFAGIYISYLLILKQLHVQSKYADKICSLFHQSDCNNVLESDAAKLWGVFGWSEIGFGYFFANVLILVLLPSFASCLAIINILTLPYSLWSVWYQKVKAKQWCVLCLIVQVLLWILFILDGLFGFIQFAEIELNILLIVCIYGICMLGINWLIPVFKKGRQIEYITQELNSIKANEDVFKALLKNQPHYEVSVLDSQIYFGNLNAKLRITILTNPYCNPCALLHKRIEKFLTDTNNQVCVQYIFASFGPDLDFANKQLIATYLAKDKENFLSIIGDWFEKGKLLNEAFFNDFQLNINNLTVELEFQKHETWRMHSQLTATPTVLVNGYKLPENYRIEDLKYFTNIEIDVNPSLPK